MNYCSECGKSLTYFIPPGDDRSRYFCESCGKIHYQNPRMVVGCIPEMEDKILFCRRAIEPCYGKWTLPAGYLETLRSGENRLEDPDLARLWDDLALVTRGPLWTAERWRAILRLHSGEASARATAWAARHPEELARVPDDLRTLFTYGIREVLDADVR